MNTEKIQVVNAEAFVDTMPVQPTSGGTLHVVLEINSNNHGKHFLQKAVPQGLNPRILILNINVRQEMIYIMNPQSLTYTEGLNEATQYSSIEIYVEGKKLTEINDIKIIK